MCEKAIFEADAAEQLGVSREVLKGLRESLPLVEGEDWRRGRNNRVEIEPAGLSKLYDALELYVEKNLSGGADAAAVGAGASEAAREGDAGDDVAEVLEKGPVRDLKVVTARVTGTPKNRKILECVLLEVVADVVERMRVRVPDNRKFVPGMVLKARKAEQCPGVWYLEGRCPRRRGHW